MSPGVVALIMLAILVFAIMIGFPVAFTLMALGVGFGYYAYFQPGQEFFDNRVFSLLTQNTYGVMTNDALVSVPLFLLMGYMVERANILDSLFGSLQVALRRVPGSLAVATLATCALFATATGIVGAVVTLMGLLAFPQMLKAGYDVRVAAGVVCAGGCLGILIPPSIMLIVYGAQAGISVVKLYSAALLPGFLLAGLYIVYVIGLAVLKPATAPALPRARSRACPTCGSARTRRHAARGGSSRRARAPAPARSARPTTDPWRARSAGSSRAARCRTASASGCRARRASPRSARATR